MKEKLYSSPNTDSRKQQEIRIKKLKIGFKAAIFSMNQINLFPRFREEEFEKSKTLILLCILSIVFLIGPAEASTKHSISGFAILIVPITAGIG